MDANEAPSTSAELEPSTAKPADGSDSSPDATLTDETLVEEISIDGMCGVY